VSGDQHGRSLIGCGCKNSKGKNWFFLVYRLLLCFNVGYEKAKIFLNPIFSQNCVKENNRIIDFIGKFIIKANRKLQKNSSFDLIKKLIVSPLGR
jgi:hypothetical protein